MTTAVRFEQLTFTYPAGARPVLNDVDVVIEQGSFVLVAGPTGAGKSTLLRAMNGLVPHFTGGRFAGSVFVEGRDTLAHPPRRLADVVAYVPQQPDAAFVLDRVEDELAYAMENLGSPRGVMRRKVEEVLDLLHIAELRDRSVRSLSGGERQRVAIAAALTPGPRLLVLDEPTSQLDPQGAEDVLAALQRLVHDLGITVVVAEHRLERVAGFADRVVVCDLSGRVEMGSPQEVLARLGLGPPVARLGAALSWMPVPLTVRDARRFASTVVLPHPVPDAPVAARPVVATARAVTARYGRIEALRGIDMALTAGTITAVVGRNGSGKTTLLRCLAGLHEPASGRVEVGDGRPRPGERVVLVPQDPDAALFCESVTDEVAATLRAHGRDPSGAGWWVREVGLEEVAARHPRDLSAGQRALAAIAAIAAVDPLLLLLDEPTRGLDPDCKIRLVRFLREAARAGKAVAFASHDVELVAEVADRVVLLAAGRVVAEGAPSEILGDSPVFAPQVARVFGKTWLTVDQVLAAAGTSV